MSNRLRFEKSPYLLQHAGNPVDWFAWGAEAFDEARRLDRPIFLSVGYSTCHWCHVMERESFEDPEVAAVLNAGFVSVKVDREERPDVDRLYMAYVQAATGSGGWPMSVWLTPDLGPFFGGTYFPPVSRWGRPGFLDLLRDIVRAWRDERPAVVSSSESTLARLAGVGRREASGDVPGEEALERAVEHYRAVFDERHGGFGGAPKFPRPSDLVFLLAEHARTGAAEPLDMALATLRAIASGGMRDHLGGGFHRYSVDGAWRVPHFEKMLYDQAQLALAYLDAARITGDAWFAEVARDTLDYVRRDLTSPSGGFCSAEDADSLPLGAPPGDRKAEGAFYIWTDDEIGIHLGADADAFRLRYGVEASGNAPHDPQGEFGRGNLLYVARPEQDVARLLGADPADVKASLRRARATLLDARGARRRPHLDDKILTAWNGLMIAAFARGALVLGAFEAGAAADATRMRYLEPARRAAAFIRDTLWEPRARGLLRRFRDGESAVPAFAEDHASLIFGLIELFQADHDTSWLEWAVELQARLDGRFRDARGGGWFSTDGGDPSIRIRLKDDHDGAEPAASSLAAWNLLALERLTGRHEFGDRAGQAIAAFAPQLEEAPRAVPMMAAALSAWHARARSRVTPER